MGLSLEDRKKGGRAVAALKGKEWMSKIGKKGRRMQLKKQHEKTKIKKATD